MKKQIGKKGLWSILKPVSFEIYFGMFLAALGSISLILSLTLLSFALANIFINAPIELFGYQLDLFNTIVILAILTIIAFTSVSTSFTITHLGAFKLEQILRTKLSSHFSKVPLGYITTTGSGALKKIMQNDVTELHTFVADTTPMISRVFITPTLSFTILLILDYRLAIASVIPMLIGFIPLAFSMKDVAINRKLYQKAQEEVNNAVVEFAQAMPVVRTFDDGSSSFKKYNDSLYNYRDSIRAWMAQNALPAKFGIIVLSPLPTLFSVLVTSIYLLNSASVEFVAVILALFLSTTLADSLLSIMWLNDFIRRSQAAALKIFEIMDIKPLPQVKTSAIPKDSSISFKDVDFSYGESSKNALNNISFEISKGSVTALVGSSGSGKSTIAKLIPRFWDVSRGSIKIGGVDLRDMTTEVLMDKVSFVFQDTFLFHDSIYNNIKMANPNASKKDVINAARAAQIHDFIETLANGYDTKAGDRGANLSGGQKQRITIARAILRDNPIIILDEATAFADPENEEEIIKALANLMKDKTVLVIAHRLSTIKDVDQIIVLDDGKIVERGCHEELLENKKVYSNLWDNYLQAQDWNIEVDSNGK